MMGPINIQWMKVVGIIVVFIVKYEIVGEDSGCNDGKTYYLQ